jgi:hypothetical protein
LIVFALRNVLLIEGYEHLGAEFSTGAFGDRKKLDELSSGIPFEAFGDVGEDG